MDVGYKVTGAAALLRPTLHGADSVLSPGCGHSILRIQTRGFGLCFLRVLLGSLDGSCQFEVSKA